MYTFANSPTTAATTNPSNRSSTTSSSSTNPSLTGSSNNPSHHGSAGSIRRQVSNIDMPAVKTGIFGASSNLVNSIVGAGIIGIPYSINQSGFVVGTFLIIFVGYLTDKSLRMIIELATFHPKLRNLGVLTYEDMMSIPYGRFGNRFILINMLILAYGAMVAYLLIIKDTLPTVLGLGNSFIEREVVMFLTSVSIMVPLSMMRDISQLSFTSFISVIADAMLVLIVVIYSPYTTTVADAGGIGAIIQNNWINANMFIGLGVISTAMACQHSAFLISGTLENHTAHRWSVVTARSLFVATAMSVCLGVFGYLGYLTETRGDILLNFENESNVVNAGRLLLAITMFLTYPMESFVARHVVAQLLYNGNMDNTSIGPNGEILPESKFCCLGRRERLTFGIYIMTLLPALILKDLGPVLSITGSIGASCLAYIAPGMVYLGINGTDFCLWVHGSHPSRPSSNTVNDGAVTEIELPVVGDATARQQPSSEYADLSNTSHRRPWWWFLLGMPLWVSIAQSGERGTRSFLTDLGVDDETNLTSAVDGNETIIGPCRRDYVFSILFIIFGIIAAVAGVVSNIWVQVHNIFYTPT